MDNAFFFNHIMDMGGTESFLYYLAKKYKDRSITVYYRTGDAEQLERLRQYVEVKRYDENERVKCKKAFFCYTNEHIDNVDAEEYIQMIHADFKAQGVKPFSHPKLTRYIAVSQSAANSFTELTGKPCEVCYNPISLDGIEKPLILVSATRLSKEKGKNRMIKLANKLKYEGVPFIWYIFTNDKNAIQNENVVYVSPRNDVAQILPIADWFVQLSDCEAYCYSVVEANMQGVPCITTPLKVFDELGIQGVRLDFDVENVPIDELKHPPKVKYAPPPDKWGKILTKTKSTYQKPKKRKLVKVTAIRNYNDVELHRSIKKGTVRLVTPERAKELNERGCAR